MSLRLYRDVHVQRAVTAGLRLRGVDVLTAQEDGSERLADPELLDPATAMGRVLFSQDEDLLREGTRRQRVGEPFASVIYAHQLNVTAGRCIDDLELIAKAEDADDYAGRVVYLPLS